MVYRAFFKKDSVVYQKFNNLENLLLDIRDNTKTFYREKRKFPRLKNSLVARISGESELIKVLDIGYGGARLKTTKSLRPKDELGLSIYLPAFPQPIVMKARVIWVSMVKTEGQPEVFDVGVEYLETSRFDREKLIETINLLEKTRPK